MKVLWFSNTPSLAAAYLNMPTVGGGWISSLEEKIKENANINLAVAFKHGEEKLNKFTYNNTLYYAIPDNTSKYEKLVQRHLNKFNDDQLIAACLKIIEEFKPDVINIFGTEEAYGLIIDKIKIPVIIHLQGILTVYEKKWFVSNISKRDLIFNSGFKSLLMGDSLIHSYYRFKKAGFREQRIFKMCKYIKGLTDWDRRISQVLSPGAVYFNSDDTLRTEFYHNTWNKKPGELKIFTSTVQGNIYKGLETVLESAVLLKQLNKFNFTWYINGVSGNDLVVKIFEKKVGKQFKDYNIIFNGKLAADELIKKALEADIFVHSSHIENSPNAVCEAMLLGMPVIATYTGGTSSLLIDKKEGLLIQDGDPYSMAGAILELVNDPDYAATLGQNARDRAIKRNDPDAVVKNVINIYSEMISHQYN